MKQAGRLKELLIRRKSSANSSSYFLLSSFSFIRPHSYFAYSLPVAQNFFWFQYLSFAQLCLGDCLTPLHWSLLSLLSGVYSLSSANYCSNPFEIFFKWFTSVFYYFSCQLSLLTIKIENLSTIKSVFGENEIGPTQSELHQSGQWKVILFVYTLFLF